MLEYIYHYTFFLKAGAEEIFDAVSAYSVPIQKKSDAEAAKPSATWSDLDEYAVYLYQLDAVQHKQRIKDAQKAMHTQLDEQVESSKGKMDWVKVEDQKWDYFLNFMQV